jgi:hypothetical protein
MLLAEFKNAFLYGNRHLLFVEVRHPTEVTPLPQTPDTNSSKPEEGLVAKEV